MSLASAAVDGTNFINRSGKIHGRLATCSSTAEPGTQKGFEGPGSRSAVLGPVLDAVVQ